MDNYEFLAWTLDLEGYITISKSIDNRVNAIYYQPNVEVENTSLNILYCIQKKTNLGTINLNPRCRKGYSDSNIWRMRASEIRKYLPLVKEHLITKAEQAGLVLELLQLKRPNGVRKSNIDRYQTDERRLKMEMLYYKCKALNEKNKIITRTSAEELEIQLRMR